MLTLLCVIGNPPSLLCAAAGTFQRRVEEVQVHVDWIPCDAEVSFNERAIDGRRAYVGTSICCAVTGMDLS